MILTELKSYLVRHGRAPLSDLANHFGSDPDAIRGMLDHFIRKGRVQKLDTGSACGGCAKCDTLALEIYQWTGDDAGKEPRVAPETCQISRSLP